MEKGKRAIDQVPESSRKRPQIDADRTSPTGTSTAAPTSTAVPTSSAAPSAPETFTSVNTNQEDSTPQLAASTSRPLRHIRAFTCLPVEIIDVDKELDVVPKKWPHLADDEELLAVKSIAMSLIE